MHPVLFKKPVQIFLQWVGFNTIAFFYQVRKRHARMPVAQTQSINYLAAYQIVLDSWYMVKPIVIAYHVEYLHRNFQFTFTLSIFPFLSFTLHLCGYFNSGGNGF